MQEHHQHEDKVGTGDFRFEDESTTTGANMPGTPGYVGESSQRHHEYTEATQPEIRSTQLIPGPLDEQEEATEGQMHFENLKMQEKTRHSSR